MPDETTTMRVSKKVRDKVKAAAKKKQIELLAFTDKALLKGIKPEKP